MSFELPIFALPLVALPGEDVPLHVFELRYQALVKHCLAEDAEFGILFGDDEGVREVGCAAKITRIVNRNDDGTIDLVATGTRRFALSDATIAPDGGDGFPQASIDWFDDAPHGPHDEPDPSDVEQLFAELGQRVTGAIPEYSMQLPTSFAIAAKVAFGPHARQGLLELRSEQDRLDLLVRLLRAALARLSQAELRQAQAHSNGKVHFE